MFQALLLTSSCMILSEQNKHLWADSEEEVKSWELTLIEGPEQSLASGKTQWLFYRLNP